VKQYFSWDAGETNCTRIEKRAAEEATFWLSTAAESGEPGFGEDCGETCGDGPVFFPRPAFISFFRIDKWRTAQKGQRMGRRGNQRRKKKKKRFYLITN
jgi:hypothetical protein